LNPRFQFAAHLSTAHISEDRLEEYAFNRLSEPESAEVEEHLLVCEDCQELVGNIDEYIRLSRTPIAPG